MKTWLVHTWNRLRTSFWFVPGGLVLCAMFLAWAALGIDRAGWLDDLPYRFGMDRVSAEGARVFLATVATASLTLAGLTFSATLVALTLASGQFGGRILRNFIRALPNQVTTGLLLANFTLCLIVLRGMGDGGFVPRLATLCVFFGALASLTAFIHFIHHIAVSLQADHVVACIHNELDETIQRFFPDARPSDPEENEAGREKDGWDEVEDELPVKSKRSGYIQAVDVPGLVEDCARRGLRCRVLSRPGHFVHAGEPVLAVDAAGVGDGADPDRLLEHVFIGPIRTAAQDFEFCLRQLVEVALRALSPGINDPFTAMSCIDYLGAALVKVARRKLPRRRFADADDVPRVWVRPTVFADLLDASFNQIRQASGDRPDIAIRLIERLGDIARAALLESHREAAAAQASAVRDRIMSAAPECDREAVEQRWETFTRAVSGR
ncbi:MAG TPA: DUF2254 domain-containing protein [Luteolibacter sp.]|nr:DUF2254 domain-containing protein [Luteolibacter sp.]